MRVTGVQKKGLLVDSNIGSRREIKRKDLENRSLSEKTTLARIG